VNLLEAVQVLKDGRCTEILSYHKNTYYLNPFTELCWKTEPHRPPDADELLGDWQLVNPEPQTETVEIDAFVVSYGDKCGSFHQTRFDAEAAAKGGVKGEVSIGSVSYTREVKPKVKQREEIEIGSDAMWHSVHSNSGIPDNTKNGHFFYEWEE
jgi:hypothetical protein